MNNILKKVAEKMRHGPFDPDRHMKAHIAWAYLKDCNDLLWRVGVALHHNGDYGVTSFKAKICVDLIMSVECSLKSLIVSLSQKSESAEDAYLTARKLSHKLKDLEGEAIARAKYKIAIRWRNTEIINDAVQLGVKVRYWSDITIIDFMEREANKPFMPTFIDGTIRDEKWIKKFNILAHDIKKSADIALKKYFRRTGIMTGSEIVDWEDRFKSFIKKIGYA